MAPRSLGPGDTAALRQLLLQDVDTNLFLLGTLDQWGLHRRDGSWWWGCGDRRVLQAAVWVGRGSPPGTEPRGLAVPWGTEPESRALGARLAARHPPAMVIGPRAAADALWEGLGGPAARTWFDQRLYVQTRDTDGPRLRLRVARVEELDAVADMAGRMMAEDLGQDPRIEDPDTHRERVRARILAGRVLLGFDPDGPDDAPPVFKLDVGSRYGAGAQVGGTYVEPHARGRGLGAAGMRAACAALRRQRPGLRLTLHVNEANTAAVRTYARVGFQAAAPFRLAMR